MSDRNPSTTLENRLGIDGTQTKVDMGPVQCVPRLDGNTHRIPFHFLFDINSAPVLGRVAHLTEPLDVRLIIGLERGNKLGRN